MSYSSDLTDDQGEQLQQVFNAAGRRGRRHSDDPRTVVDAMLYIAHRLPVVLRAAVVRDVDPDWSQFRRWSRNGRGRLHSRCCTRPRASLTGEPSGPRRGLLDTHLARGASHSGFTFDDRGGPYGHIKGARRVIAVDVTRLPVAALVVGHQPTRTEPAG